MKSKWSIYRRVIEKHGHLICEYCSVPVFIRVEQTDPQKATVDHIVPRAKGGSDRMSNLKLACQACNSIKGAA